MRRLALGTAVWALVAPGSTFGLGLGEIEPRSALNQPLRAEIRLVSADPREVEDLVVRLAPPALFERMGIPRPPVLTRLEFEPVALPDGGYRIRVTSDGPVREPFLNFLVEASWPNGRLVREYTLLLDPPALFEQSRPEPAAALAGRGDDGRADGAGAAGDSALPETHRVRAGDTLWALGERFRPGGDITVEQMMMALLRANPEAFGEGNINNLRRGQVLRIPGRDEVTRLSPAEARQAVARQNALWEDYRRQAAEAPRPQTPAQGEGGDETRPTAQGEEGPSAEEAAGGEGQPPVAGLEIVAREAQGEGEVERLQRELALVRETTESRRQEAQELRERIRELESLLERQSRLLGVTNEQLARLQARMGPEDTAASEPPAVETAPPSGAESRGEGATPPAPDEGSGEAPASSPAPTPSPESPAAPEVQRPSSPVASILQSPTLLGGIGVAVLLLGALALLMLRRLRGAGAGEPEREPPPVVVPERDRSTPAVAAGAATAGLAAGGPTAPAEADLNRPAGEDTQHTATEFAAPARESAPAPAPAEGDAGEAPASREEGAPPQGTPTAASQTLAQGQNPDEVSNDDTIAEADVYLAYGLYTQARELLETALEEHPERLDYHFKLAETHFSAHDADAFTRAATAMHERLGDRPSALWERVVTMGQELAPENPLFGGAGAPQSSAASAPEAPAGATSASGPGLRDDLDETLLQPRPQTEEGLGFGSLAQEEGAATPPSGRDEDRSPGLPALEDFDLDLPEDLSTAGTQPPGDTDEEAPTRFLESGADRGDTASGSTLPTLELERPSGGPLGKEEEGQAGAASRGELPELDLDLDLDSAGLGFELDGEESPTDEDREGAGREASFTEPSTTRFDLEDFFHEDEAGSAGDEESLDEEDFVLGDEISTKLDLARAYIDMGDAEGARTTLEEVIAEGNEEQQQEARELMQQIP
ncbi:FimV/HubP family polar landmark protein [Ectothiorhodospira mobilis]|uniref:FimV/HubP family polar landmark protein n=1 Tax=Ectothiorhodospira mobilis TaxID=195064 RepID=UPI001EE8DB41|nr:LysM peptidoglycan-binding domain-containing protein [Ectothiorhodospira mobilis]